MIRLFHIETGCNRLVYGGACSPINLNNIQNFKLLVDCIWLLGSEQNAAVNDDPINEGNV